MKTKEELTKLAKDKGFVSEFLHSKPFLYSKHEPLRWLFWLTEVQKWLIENHNMNVGFNNWITHNDYVEMLTNYIIHALELLPDID